MDTKVTLSFDESVITRAKKFAGSKGLSLSRLTEILLTKAMSTKSYSIEDYPIASWVSEVSEPEAKYITKKRSNKSLKSEFYKSRK
jgi:Family of unknown function (DUF6364)